MGNKGSKSADIRQKSNNIVQENSIIFKKSLVTDKRVNNQIVYMDIEKFEKIFGFLFVYECDGSRQLNNSDIECITKCCYNYYLKVMDDILLVYYYYYESKPETELVIVRSNGKIYKCTSSDLYGIAMDIRYLDYLSIMSKYVDDKYLEKYTILSTEKCLQLISILIDLQIGIFQCEQGHTFHVIRHCGKQIATMNMLRKKSYRNANKIDNQPLNDFMMKELGIRCNMPRLPDIGESSEWSVKIDNYHSMLNLTK